MPQLTKSRRNEIEVLSANGLSTFIDDTDGVAKWRDTNGIIEPITNYVGSATGTLYYGSFFSTQTQTTLGSEQKVMTLNNTDLSYGVVVQNSSQMKVLYAGAYNLAFSAQIQKTTGGTKEILNVFLKKNGQMVDNSNTQVTLANNTDLYVIAWNFFVSLNANDYVELGWWTIDSHIQLTYTAGTANYPAVPSVIATLNKVG